MDLKGTYYYIVHTIQVEQVEKLFGPVQLLLFI